MSALKIFLFITISVFANNTEILDGLQFNKFGINYTPPADWSIKSEDCSQVILCTVELEHPPNSFTGLPYSYVKVSFMAIEIPTTFDPNLYTTNSMWTIMKNNYDNLEFINSQLNSYTQLSIPSMSDELIGDEHTFSIYLVGSGDSELKFLHEVKLYKNKLVIFTRHFAEYVFSDDQMEMGEQFDLITFDKNVAKLSEPPKQPLPKININDFDILGRAHKNSAFIKLKKMKEVK